MFTTASMVIIIAVFLALYRALAGPTVFDRVLATNVIGTKTVVLLALIGFVYERPHFLDIALVYALINFIMAIVILRYFESGRPG